MQEIRVTPAQLTDPSFAEQHAAEPSGDVRITLVDGDVLLPMQLALFNGLLWPIYQAFDIPITKDKVFFPDRKIDKDTNKAVYSFTADTVSRCNDQIYNELILKYKVKNHMEALTQIWLAINRIARFADRYTCSYLVSLDTLSLAKLCAQKPMKDLMNKRIDASHGTKYAEKQFSQFGSDMMKLLAKPDALHDNVLMPFMLTKLLKRNQLPQMFVAYGPRSDITDEMMHHVISSSAWSGLEGVEDYATESLSAKKAEYFNSAVIQDAQYFARRCRLAATNMPKLYAGSCGNTVTLPVVIDPEDKNNYIGKFVKVDDSTKDLLKTRKWEPQHGEDYSVELTPANIDRFVGREIQMWSPIFCKHTDGCCEHCAGYMHQRLGAYIPEGIHLGIFATTKVVSAVTQKILSAKHLIKTSSKEYVFNPRASKFFVKSGDAIVWQPGVVRGIRKCFVRIANECIQGPLNDLTRKILPTGVSFSRIDNVGIVNSKGETIEMVELANDDTVPYFSAYMMTYLQQHYKELKIDADYIDIPMKEFDFDRAFLKYTATNDDMVSYVKRVENFVTSRIVDYTSISSCLRDFAKTIWNKTEVNIFAIEIMLRGYLTSREVAGIPVIVDPYTLVTFSNQGDIISSAALSTKLAYQGVKDFFRDPEPTLNAIGTGYGFYDSLFNYARVE